MHLRHSIQFNHLFHFPNITVRLLYADLNPFFFPISMLALYKPCCVSNFIFHCSKQISPKQIRNIPVSSMGDRRLQALLSYHCLTGIVITPIIISLFLFFSVEKMVDARRIQQGETIKIGAPAPSFNKTLYVSRRRVWKRWMEFTEYVSFISICVLNSERIYYVVFLVFFSFQYWTMYPINMYESSCLI